MMNTKSKAVFFMALMGCSWAGCTLDNYYTMQGKETTTVDFKDDKAYVSMERFSPTFIDFAESPLSNDDCEWSSTNANGYTRTCKDLSDPDCCFITLKKTFDGHEFMESCSRSFEEGVATTVETKIASTATLEGNPVGGRPTTVTIQEPPTTIRSMFPNSAATSISFEVDAPPDCEIEIDGFAGYIDSTKSIQVQLTEAANSPYRVKKTYPEFVYLPSEIQTGGIYLTRGEEYDEGWNYYYLLETLVPVTGQCGVSGKTVFTQELECRPNKNCKMNELGLSPYINITVNINLIDCSEVVHNYDTTLQMFVENSAGEKVSNVLQDQPFNAVVELISEIEPIGVLDAHFTLLLKDFGGKVLEQYEDIQDNPAFSPHLVSASSTEEIVSFIIPDSMVDEQGNVIELRAAAQVNFVSVTRSAAAATAEGALYFSVGDTGVPSGASTNNEPIDSDAAAVLGATFLVTGASMILSM